MGTVCKKAFRTPFQVKIVELVLNEAHCLAVNKARASQWDYGFSSGMLGTIVAMEIKENVFLIS